MIARSLKIGLLTMMASTSFFSCTSGTRSGDGLDDPVPEEVAGPTFTTTLVLRDSAGAEKYTFQRTELITFELSVRNRTAQPANVSLSTTQASDFFVFPNGGNTALWFCSTGMAFPTVVTTLTFAANETKVMQCTWNQELDQRHVPAQRQLRGAWHRDRRRRVADPSIAARAGFHVARLHRELTLSASSSPGR